MPLTFDLPLDQLPAYLGRTPRPADFDEFWDKGLKEMAAVDPKVELVPADIETSFAECFWLSFTGIGGARIEAKYVRPRQHSQMPRPAVLHFHGYGQQVWDWTDGPTMALAAEGISTFALNARGQGGRSEDLGGVRGTTFRGHIVRGLIEAMDGQPEKLLFRSIFLDAAQLARIAMATEGIDPARVGAWGGSQGGGLALACAALEPRIARVAPSYPFLSDYRRVWEMDQAREAYAELQDWFRQHDPLHARENEAFTALGYIDIQNLASRIRGEVLWRIGLMDKICPPSTQFAAYNKLTAKKTMLVYPDYQHERLPLAFDQVFSFMRKL